MSTKKLVGSANVVPNSECKVKLNCLDSIGDGPLRFLDRKSPAFLNDTDEKSHFPSLRKLYPAKPTPRPRQGLSIHTNDSLNQLLDRNTVKGLENHKLELLNEEHKERVRTHNSIFKNVLGSEATFASARSSSIAASGAGSTNLLKGQKKFSKKASSTQSKKSFQEEPNKSVQAEAAKIFSMFKDHLESEMMSGLPKHSLPRIPSQFSKTQQKNSKMALSPSSSTRLERTPLKFESYRKLQRLVDSSKEKILPPPTPSSNRNDYRGGKERKDDDSTLSEVSEINEEHSKLARVVKPANKFKLSHQTVLQNVVLSENEAISVSSNDRSVESSTASELTELKEPEEESKSSVSEAFSPEWKNNPFYQALSGGKGDENEMYSILKRQLEFEMTGGPPKLSLRREPSYTKPSPKSSGESLLRSDVVGRALLKYGNKKKAQDQKQNSELPSTEERLPTPLSALMELSRSGPAFPPSPSSVKKVDFSLPLPTLPKPKAKPKATQQNTHKVEVNPSFPPASQSILASRKKLDSEVSATLAKSMKTIDRATDAVQRLGKLMSRITPFAEDGGF